MAAEAARREIEASDRDRQWRAQAEAARRQAEAIEQRRRAEEQAFQARMDLLAHTVVRAAQLADAGDVEKAAVEAWSAKTMASSLAAGQPTARDLLLIDDLRRRAEDTIARLTKYAPERLENWRCSMSVRGRAAAEQLGGEAATLELHARTSPLSLWAESRWSHWGADKRKLQQDFKALCEKYAMGDGIPQARISALVENAAGAVAAREARVRRVCSILRTLSAGLVAVTTLALFRASGARSPETEPSLFVTAALAAECVSLTFFGLVGIWTNLMTAWRVGALVGAVLTVLAWGQVIDGLNPVRPAATTEKRPALGSISFEQGCNLRSAPNKDGEVLGWARPGEPYRVVALDHGWRQIEVAHVIGWTGCAPSDAEKPEAR